MNIKFSFLTLFILAEFFVEFASSIKTHMHSRHPKFKKRTFAKASLFANLYNLKPTITFRFEELMARGVGTDGAMKDKMVLMRGWVKFIVIDPDNPRKFTNFYNNDAFDEQQKRSYNKDEEDEFGKIDIQDRVHFFAYLTPDGLYIVTARRNDIAKTTASVAFKTLYPQSKSATGSSGGIEDIGNFKEGNCLKLRQRDEGVKEWILCMDSSELKAQWLVTLISLKMKQQGGEKGNGDDSLSTEVTIHGPFGLVGSKWANKKGHGEKSPDGDDEDPNAPKDGEWVVLQDWSSCTLACGGGTQTLQRGCKPPKNGGKPCKGEAVLERPCNTQPCPPEFSDGNAGGPKIEEEEAPLKVKMMKVTGKPQRYETCIIKEGDLDVVQEQIMVKRKPRLPAHIILNNRTFTVFAGSHYETVVFSVGLGDIMINENWEDDAIQCFVIKNTKARTHIVLCSFAESSKGPEQIKSEWVNAISFFRSKCYASMKFAPDPDDVDPALAMKRKALDEETMEAKAAGGAAVDSRAAAAMAKSLQELQALALDAISKEVKYEQMMENEERIRQEDEQKELLKKLEAMKLKQDCLNREVKKKAAKSEADIREKQVDFDFEGLKDEIKNLIMRKRGDQSKRIEMMKKMGDRRKRGILNQINELQTRMAKDMMKAEKVGNASVCDPKINNKESINEYCNENINDDPAMNKDCKDPDSFCFICCELEVGVFYVAKRDACMAKCDQGKKPEKGNWVWVPESNKVKRRL